MKTIRFIITLLILGNLTANVFAEGDPETDTKKSAAIKKKTVLVVGLKKGNITSNFYSPEGIAEKTTISADSLEDVFSRKIIESINRKNDKGLNVVPLMFKPKHSILGKVTYHYEKDVLVSDLSDLSSDDVQSLLNQYNADYVMFIGNYYLKFEGGSNLFHIIKYDVYNKSKKNILSEKVYFNTPELLPLASFEKKFERSGSKILEQLNKASE
jgi:ABC-type transport system substrate-binding protein